MTYGKDSVFPRLQGDVNLGGIFSDGVRDLHIFSPSLDLVKKTVPAIQGLNEQVKSMTITLPRPTEYRAIYCINDHIMVW